MGNVETLTNTLEKIKNYAEKSDDVAMYIQLFSYRTAPDEHAFLLLQKEGSNVFYLASGSYEPYDKPLSSLEAAKVLNDIGRITNLENLVSNLKTNFSKELADDRSKQYARLESGRIFDQLNK